MAAARRLMARRASTGVLPLADAGPTPAPSGNGRSKRLSMSASQSSLNATMGSLDSTPDGTNSIVRSKVMNAVQKARGEELESMIDKNMTEIEAVKALGDAMEANDAGQLLRTIGQAKFVGVDEGLLKKATRQMQCLEATEALDRMIQNGDATGLAAAIVFAKKVGVEDIDKYTQTLETVRCEETLMNAINSGQSGALKYAISLADDRALHGCPADSALVEQAKKMLNVIEAEFALTTALRQRKVDTLTFAIEQAEKAGVDQKLMMEAQTCLEIFRSEDAAKTSQQQSQRKSMTIDDAFQDLKKAIEIGETGMLRLALKKVAHLGDQEDLKKTAQNILDKAEAQILLTSAVKTGKDRKKLKDAVSRAEQCEHSSAEFERAKFLLRQMEVRDALSNAMTSKDDLNGLETAILEAREFGIEPQKIQKAEQTLAKRHAKIALDAASMTFETDPDGLKAAIDAAKAAGVEPKELQKAMQLLQPRPERTKNRRSSV